MVPPVPVFFYGGLINPRMLERLGIEPPAQHRAMLPGYDLTIRPWANVEPAAYGQVFGVVMEMAHDELEQVYSRLAIRYVPRPVVVHQDGRGRPALCYMAQAPMAPAPAEADHVAMLLEAAEAHGFPGWYLDRIRSYLPGIAGAPEARP